MGMYPQYKEIPAVVLHKLLERPEDAAWVDGLLFDASGETWKAPMDALGRLDLGKYPAWDRTLPFAYLLKLAQDSPDEAKLQWLMASIGTSVDRLEDQWGATFGSPAVIESHQPRWGTAEKPSTGFASLVPCYGILSYRMPKTLQLVWQLLCTVCTRCPDQLPWLQENFGEEIRYYEACATRGSADLYVMW